MAIDLTNTKNTPHQCIIKGDGKYYPLAAASILAKTNRDEYMKKMDNEHPDYRWKKTKGTQPKNIVLPYKKRNYSTS